jgi:hypothetical protein
MKAIGDVLALVLDYETQKKAAGQSRLQSEWSGIVEEAFLGKLKKTPSVGSAGKNGIYSEDLERDRVTARKTAEHSRIAYIKNNMLYIETDHQGWAQILQTVQSKIISIINKKHSNISVNALVFLFVNRDEEASCKQEKESKESVEIIKQRVENNTNKELYGKIKDEHLQSILMDLEARINMRENMLNWPAGKEAIT